MTTKHPKDNNQTSEPLDTKLNQTDMSQDAPYPISNSLQKKPKKRVSTALIVAIIGLSALLLIVVYKQFSNTAPVAVSPNQNNNTATTPAVIEQPPTAEPIVIAEGSSEEATMSSKNLQTNTPNDFEVNIENIPTPEEILSAPIPESDLLVKEEIQRLTDEEKRLKEQKVLLIEQVEMMDELNDKKENQVTLLEQQIAQLEQQNKSE